MWKKHKLVDKTARFTGLTRDRRKKGIERHVEFRW